MSFKQAVSLALLLLVWSVSGASIAQESQPYDLYPPSFYHMEPAVQEQPPEPDYYATVYQASANKVLRFRLMPVPVFVEMPPDRSYLSAVADAFSNWQKRTHNRFRFVTVGDIEQARIIITWKHFGLNPDYKASSLGAHTIMSYVPNTDMFTQRSQKYVVPPQQLEVNLDLLDTKPKEIKLSVLCSLIAHELGHALGLLGHSTDNNDLMFISPDEYSRISDRDLNTLYKLYSLPVEVPL